MQVEYAWVDWSPTSSDAVRVRGDIDRLQDEGRKNQPPILPGSGSKSPIGGDTSTLLGDRGAAARVAYLIRPLRDLVDDPQDLGTSVDRLELVGHSRGARTIVRFVEHAPHGLAQRLRCRTVGCKIDSDPGPRHPRVHVPLVFR